jgi:predicted GNAT superfamily acetyltransferase
MNEWTLHILETPAEMRQVEDLQRVVWSGDETEIVPVNMLIAAVHNGGLAIGAYAQEDQEKARLIGFVFGFPGFYLTADGPRLKHCSHMLAVIPDYRNRGLGFALKRAQWQMVRHQGLDRISWTYDPLLSRNAFLNIAKLGAVCNTYLEEVYGEMRDGLNVGLPSDRFEVDWWVSTKRVERRMSRWARRRLDLAHFIAAGTGIINPTELGPGGWPRPLSSGVPDPAQATFFTSDLTEADDILPGPPSQALLLVEIPADFMALKAADLDLALAWRLHTRDLFENLFASGYLVTDFVHLPGVPARSFYVLSHGESTF